MRVVTWNLNHRARARAVRPEVVEVLAQLRADVVVLTEYVRHQSATTFHDALERSGLTAVATSDAVVGENSVIIAARSGLARGGIKGPPIAAAVPSNVLHVIASDLGVDVLGLRIPDYSKQPPVRRACWDWLESAAAELKSRPAILIGDLNTDPSYPRARCGDRFARLAAAGWSHVAASGGSSYWAPNGHGRQLDHCFVTEHFATATARYEVEVGGHLLCGKRPEALSDHAALVVDAELKVVTAS